MLTLSKNCFLVAGIAANQELTFTIVDAKLYVHVVTLSTQDNMKLLKKIESDFKTTINWNKYQSKTTEQAIYTTSNIFNRKRSIKKRSKKRCNISKTCSTRISWKTNI